MTTSLRGGFNAVVEVRTLDHAVHNGVYGGPVPDALTALVRLLATLHDEHGDVAVAGLWRTPADPLDLTDTQLRADAGMLDGVQLIGTGTLTSRLWTAPAISVSGIDAPDGRRRADDAVPQRTGQADAAHRAGRRHRTPRATRWSPTCTRTPRGVRR